MSRKLRKSEFWVYVLITVPALAFYLFAVVAPFLFGTIPSSFRNWNVMKNTNTFTGMANYVHMFTKDAAFAKSLRFTVKLGLGSLIFVNLFALLVALMLEKKHVFARNAARTIFFLPNVISGIIIAYTWQFVYLQLIPSIGKMMGIPLLTKLSWFSTPNMAMLAILSVDVWKSLGCQMIIFINGLQSIPEDILEAATMERCSGWKMLWHIKLPLLMPSFTVCLLLTIIGAFKSFDLSYALTGGDPMQTTQTIAYNIYYEAFTCYRLGYACAKSVILMLIIAATSILQLRVTRKKEVQM